MLLSAPLSPVSLKLVPARGDPCQGEERNTAPFRGCAADAAEAQ